MQITICGCHWDNNRSVAAQKERRSHMKWTAYMYSQVPRQRWLWSPHNKATYGTHPMILVRMIPRAQFSYQWCQRVTHNYFKQWHMSVTHNIHPHKPESQHMVFSETLCWDPQACEEAYVKQWPMCPTSSLIQCCVSLIGQTVCHRPITSNSASWMSWRYLGGGGLMFNIT